MTRVALVVAMLGACIPQSARVLPRGATQVSAGLTRIRLDDGDATLAEARIARGFGGGFELGANVARTPGADSTTTAAGLDPKLRLLEAPTASLSIGLPVSLAWDETMSDLNSPTLVALPTLYAGWEMDSMYEVVLAPRAGIVHTTRAGTTSSTLYVAGASIGIHLSGAVHSELGIVHYGGDASDTVVTFGFSVSAGN